MSSRPSGTDSPGQDPVARRSRDLAARGPRRKPTAAEALAAARGSTPSPSEPASAPPQATPATPSAPPKAKAKAPRAVKAKAAPSKAATTSAPAPTPTPEPPAPARPAPAITSAGELLTKRMPAWRVESTHAIAKREAFRGVWTALRTRAVVAHDAAALATADMLLDAARRLPPRSFHAAHLRDEQGASWAVFVDTARGTVLAALTPAEVYLVGLG